MGTGASVERHEFVQEGVVGTDEFLEVREVADRLHAHLNTPEALTLIEAANQPGTSSAMVQAAFLPFAGELGFQNETSGLFASYQTAGLRPDYYLPVGDSGILLEVERGKTTTNNMDLLDFWKCHLCEHANYLFLLVPQALRHNPTMSPKREYASVVKRLESFFRPANYTNVLAAYVFGY